MSQEQHYFRVGLFVVLGLALAVGALLLLGGGRLFDRVVRFETVFAESVQGLEIGSPVKFRGVKLGEVCEIGLVGDSYRLTAEQDLEYGALVLVRFEISEEDLQDRTNLAARRDYLMSLVERGLRLKITPLGITGTSFVEANYVDPKKNPPLELRWSPEDIYIPSTRSTLGKFASAAEAILDRLNKLDIEKLVGDLDGLILSLDAGIDEIAPGDVSRALTEMIQEIQRTVVAVRQSVDGANVQGVSQSTRLLLDEANATIAQLRKASEGGSYDLEVTLENLRVTSENLRELTHTLRQQPSLLLRSAPPKDATGATP